MRGDFEDERGVGPFPGEVLEGRWRIVSILGRGGHAGVWRGEHARLGYPVAIKTLAFESGSALSDDLRARLMVEAEIGAVVRHPNVLRIFDVGSTPRSEPYLVMELVEGEPLRDVLSRGPLSISQSVDVARQALAGLSALAAHGIVHRDVKPSNVMLREGPRGVRVKLIDLGVARRCNGDPDGAPEGFLVGTPSYMAPEQLRAQPTDPRADLYALGVVLYECLTGAVPPRPTLIERFAIDPDLPIDELPPVRAKRPDCPPWLEAIVQRATAIEASARYPSAEAMNEALTVLAHDLDLRTGPCAWSGGGSTSSRPLSSRPPPPALAPTRTAPSSAPQTRDPATRELRRTPRRISWPS